MAKRIVYYVDKQNEFHNKDVEFQWFPGFARVQKQKSIASLHENFAIENPQYKTIEISSSSTEPLGISTSAFNLNIKTTHGTYTVEQLFQAGKVFKLQGKQSNLLGLSPADARKANKGLNRNDVLINFDLFGDTFPLEPKTYFYNWIYLNALRENSTLAKDILKYDAFTDINANPKYTISTQAEACSIYVSLARKGTLNKALHDKNSFLQEIYGQTIKQPEPTIKKPVQINLFNPDEG